MMLRLHYSGFVQGSFFVRNIMVQPGPLTAPPELRSKKTPSFRVIDFGRGEEWNTFVGDKTDKERLEQKEREWGNKISDEDKSAQSELQIPRWNH
ncbi:uncharacterized protein PHACADRAFT_254885 [Phanerochaete carnosa HHB-10118-sp]|uniref:Protein kinase domain-containing protein n=1 Tax=Phanerochaete carnosa (strain HHB-10118-sp) TaxID=650164 RepID=K5X346_PHACS|nr:uncharacterized protein PHACADRAFT_254885 [Phanerochaete carnosa HHB-10118-sp]EKM57232.1 hypothetical protein PHACADRAFT_254885 [Phanerochaete carnosa HHB-10118-sp]